MSGNTEQGHDLTNVVQPTGDEHAPVGTQPDPLPVDEGFEVESSAGGGGDSVYATTISSYIREGIEENGRKYASYGKYAYGLPVDEREQERNGKHPSDAHLA
jgi:hypothetical protein